MGRYANPIHFVGATYEVKTIAFNPSRPSLVRGGTGSLSLP
jgi:hypothetical protein